MNNKKKKVMFLVIYLSITLFSCNDSNPVTPIEPGSRNYEWKEFDLNSNAPLNTYSKLWGISPNKIWIAGSVGEFNKTILIFNGLQIRYYGQLSIDPKAVFGVADNEVWFAGTEFDFWKYNGNNISKFKSYPIAGYRASFFGDIWGEASNDIYAVGSVYEDSTDKVKSMIMHYDGTDWKYVIDPDYDIHFVSIRKAPNDSVYYLIGYEYITIGEAVQFFQFDGHKIKSIVIGEPTTSVYKGISLMGGELFFNNENEIYKLESGKVKHIVSLNQYPNAKKSRFWGRNEKDFFIQTINGLGHYNGTTLETVFNINGNIGLVNGLVLNDDVYFIYLDRDSFKFYLLYGKKLNE